MLYGVTVFISIINIRDDFKVNQVETCSSFFYGFQINYGSQPKFPSCKRIIAPHIAKPNPTSGIDSFARENLLK